MTSLFTLCFLPVNQIKKLEVILTSFCAPSIGTSTKFWLRLPWPVSLGYSFFHSMATFRVRRSLAALQTLTRPSPFLQSQRLSSLYSPCHLLCPWIKTPNWWPITGHNPNSLAWRFRVLLWGEAEESKQKWKRYLVVKIASGEVPYKGLHVCVIQKSHSRKLKVWQDRTVRST